MTRRCAISVLFGALEAKGDTLGLDRILAQQRGGAVLLDVKSGRVLASNRSRFIARGAFPPGSTIKPFVLASLLRAGKLRPDESFFCPGHLAISGRRMDCSHPPLGASMRVDTALAYSCNCFVAHMAGRFAPGELATALRTWGFGLTTIEPDQRLQALGEAGVLTTPAELANAYRELAHRSTSPRILEGLEGAVEFGTGQLASVSWAKLAGKTGSARTGNELIAWFAGYLPSRSPEIVVTVMLSGKHGSSDASPVAHNVLETWKRSLT
jgi:penicillin-binding protein 2